MVHRIVRGKVRANFLCPDRHGVAKGACVHIIQHHKIAALVQRNFKDCAEVKIAFIMDQKEIM